MKIIPKIFICLFLITGYSQAITSLLVQRTISPQEQQILKIDPLTGNSETIATITELSGGTSSIAVDEPNSRCFIFGYDLQSNHRLYIVNVSTGAMISNPVNFQESISDPYYNSADGMIYAQNGVTSNVQQVLKIDPATGSTTVVAILTGVSGGTTSLTVDQVGKRCFFFGYDTLSMQKIFVIDLQNDAVLNAFALNIRGCLDDPFYNPSDRMIYAQTVISVNEQAIYKIDPSSGKSVFVSSLTEHNGSTSALTVDPVNHLCYLSGYDSESNHNLFIIDLITGTLMAITPLSVQENFGDPVLMGNDIIKSGNSVFVNVNVFPNPSTGLFLISSTTFIPGEIKLEVFDAIGEKVYTQTGEFSDFPQINLSALRSGEYFIRFSGNNDAYTKKVLVIN